MLAVMAGGVVGTLARWGVAEALASTPDRFPWATLVVNVSGAFLLGAVGVLLIERLANVGNMRNFLAIGLLGSYTTFSTMALEGVRLIEARRVAIAAGYWAITLLLGQAAGLMGMWLGRWRTPIWKETA
ncbi:MAG: CrcB family protein [Acidimicrobiia bacterium]|jgi:CrcB protein